MENKQLKVDEELVRKLSEDSLNKIHKLFHESESTTISSIEDTIREKENLVEYLQKEMLLEMKPFITIIGICSAQIQELKLKIDGRNK